MRKYRSLFLIFLASSLASAAGVGTGTGSPDDSSNAFKQSYWLESQGRFSQAIEVLSSLYRKSRDDYFLNLRLGWLFRLQGSYLNAKRHYLTAEKADPKALDPQLGLFYLYLENHKTNDAIAKGKAILESHPEVIEVSKQLASLRQ